MADSFSTYLQIRLPATGAYNNTWGSTINSDSFNLLDTAITGSTVVNIGSATAYSLPALTSGTVSVARFFELEFTGAPASDCTVTVPASVIAKQYLVDNQTGVNLIFTYAGSSDTVTVANGEMRLIWCDGSNCWPITANASDASNLGGVPTANWARQSRTAAEITAATIVKNAMTIPTAYPYVTVTEAPTTTLDCNNGNDQKLTLTGNRVMAAPTNATDGQGIDLLVVQDGTGSRTLSWNAIFLFENGVTPVLGTGPGAIDRFLLRYNSALNKWTVGHFANLNTGAGTTLPITATAGLDWSLSALIGTLSSPATINILVPAGVIMESSTPGTPAMDLSGLISGCTVNLTNLGYILGKGGRGGSGAEGDFPGTGSSLRIGSSGYPAGNAIKGPGSGCTFNITNGSGHIWGGGGGGGGGGVSISTGATGGANGGGGGGGAGGGQGGLPGLQADFFGGAIGGVAGTDATSGVNGALGAGGAGGTTGTAGAGAGGTGGDWGAVGVAGTANSAQSRTAAAGSFGAAGKAIELSGGTATFTTGAGSPNVKGAVS